MLWQMTSKLCTGRLQVVNPGLQYTHNVLAPGFDGVEDVQQSKINWNTPATWKRQIIGLLQQIEIQQ